MPCGSGFRYCSAIPKMRSMESNLQTSSGPICTLSLGFAGAAGCGAGWAGVVVLSIPSLPKWDARSLRIAAPTINALEKGSGYELAILDWGSSAGHRRRLCLANRRSQKRPASVWRHRAGNSERVRILLGLLRRDDPGLALVLPIKRHASFANRSAGPSYPCAAADFHGWPTSSPHCRPSSRGHRRQAEDNAVATEAIKIAAAQVLTKPIKNWARPLPNVPFWRSRRDKLCMGGLLLSDSRTRLDAAN